MPSSAVEHFGYDPKRRELTIRYTGGRSYAYLQVPKEEYEALRRAPSLGIFVNRRIKPRYEFKEIVRRP